VTGFVLVFLISFILVFLGRKYGKQLIQEIREETDEDVSELFSDKVLFPVFGTSLFLMALISIGGVLGELVGVYLAVVITKWEQE